MTVFVQDYHTSYVFSKLTFISTAEQTNIIGIQEFDPFLGSYPLLPPTSTYPAWLKLSSHIKKSTIASVFSSSGFVSSHDDQLEDELARATKILERKQNEDDDKAAAEARKEHNQTRTTATIQEEDETEDMEVDNASNGQEDSPATAGAGVPVPSKFEPTKSNTSISFTPINLRSSFRKGAVGEEVTRYSLDKSWLLNNLFTTVYNKGNPSTRSLCKPLPFQLFMN